jgi:hypothetical protein
MKRLCALLGIVVVLTGCAATRPGPAPAATPASNPATTPNPAATLNPATTRNAPATTKPAATWSVKQAQLVSPSTGWVLATGGPKSDGTALFRTADGGRTWQDITPPGLADVDKMFASAHFVDETMGWAAFHVGQDAVPYRGRWPHMAAAAHRISGYGRQDQLLRCLSATVLRR